MKQDIRIALVGAYKTLSPPFTRSREAAERRSGKSAKRQSGEEAKRPEKSADRDVRRTETIRISGVRVSGVQLPSRFARCGARQQHFCAALSTFTRKELDAASRSDRRDQSDLLSSFALVRERS